MTLSQHRFAGIQLFQPLLVLCDGEQQVLRGVFVAEELVSEQLGVGNGSFGLDQVEGLLEVGVVADELGHLALEQRISEAVRQAHLANADVLLVQRIVELDALQLISALSSLLQELLSFPHLSYLP